MIKVSLIAGSSQKVCSFAYVQRERRKKGCSRRIGETPLPSTPGVCSGLSLTRVDWNQTERESFVQISSTLTCPIAASWVGTVNLKFTLTLLIMPEIPSLLTVIGSIWVRFWFLRQRRPYLILRRIKASIIVHTAPLGNTFNHPVCL